MKTSTFASFPACRDKPFLSLKDMILEDLLDPSCLPSYNPWDSSKQIPDQVIVGFPDVQSSDPAICFIALFQDSGFQHLTVTAAKAAPDLHILCL